MGNKKHEMLAAGWGGCFIKALRINSAAVDGDDDVIKLIRIGLVGRRCFITGPQVL
jgi:hypothetical protein